MAEPDFVFQYISILSEIIITLLGFVIIFWVFWYEHIGKNLKLNLGQRMKGFRLLWFYIKFEKNFYNNFLGTRIIFTKKTYGYLLKKLRLKSLYEKIKEKTQYGAFKYTRKIVNYHIILSFYLFLILLGFGTSAILRNVRIMHVMTHFSKEQLINDTGLPKLVDQVYDDFYLFFIIFFIYMMLVIMYTIIQYKVIKEDTKNKLDKNQILDLQSEKKMDETNLEKKI